MKSKCGLCICFRLGCSEQSKERGPSVNLLDKDRISQLRAIFQETESVLKEFIALELRLV